MPFDPAWPQNGQNIDADRFRGQFAGLIDLINQGSSITSVVVDSVTTLPPGNPATVDLSVTGGVMHFTFGIPQGNDGTVGPQGNDGPQGPPFAAPLVDSVTTLNPGDPATVNVAFDGSNVRFNFGIPRGADGANGADGEVTAMELSNAINDTSRNSNGVSVLSQTADGSYNPTQMQDLINKMDELINALRR